MSNKRIPKLVRIYCRKHAITIEIDGSDVTFLAPAGKVFSNEGVSRHFEDYEEMPAREMVGHLDLFTQYRDPDTGAFLNGFK